MTVRSERPVALFGAGCCTLGAGGFAAPGGAGFVEGAALLLLGHWMTTVLLLAPPDPVAADCCALGTAAFP